MTVVSIDQSGFERARQALEEVTGGIEEAGRLAINDTLRQLRAGATRRITAVVNLKAGDVRRRITLRRASRKRLEGAMEVSGFSRIPLYQYAARQVRRGVSYKIEKQGGRSTVPGAWLDAQRRKVFVREYEGNQTATQGAPARAGEIGGLRKRVGREPIRQVFGPSIGHVFRQHVEATVGQRALEILEERLEFHVGDLLNKAGL